MELVTAPPTVHIIPMRVRPIRPRQPADLKALGYNVISRWLTADRTINRQLPWHEERAALQLRGASEDMEDLEAADIVIAFTEPPSEDPSRAARCVQFGAALALKKRLYIVGNRETIYHCLAGSEFAEDWSRCLGQLVWEDWSRCLGQPVPAEDRWSHLRRPGMQMKCERCERKSRINLESCRVSIGASAGRNRYDLFNGAMLIEPPLISGGSPFYYCPHCAPTVSICKSCFCTREFTCNIGRPDSISLCTWAEPNLCSACVGKEQAA